MPAPARPRLGRIADAYLKGAKHQSERWNGAYHALRSVGDKASIAAIEASRSKIWPEFPDRLRCAAAADAIAPRTDSGSLPRVKMLRVVAWAGGAVVGAVMLNELTGRPIPFLRWSVLRMALGAKHLLTKWQVGDGREEALAVYVVERAKAGDVDDVIRVIDEFAYKRSFLINVGDEKGKLLDTAVSRVQPGCVLELGTYCGYSACRIARAAGPRAKIVSLEFNGENAGIARRIIAHAGLSDRITVVVGTLSDGGETARRLSAEHGFSEGSVDFVFVDHDKAAYLPDLQLIVRERWLRPGAVVVADNVRFPGAPEYRAFMQAEEGRVFKTQEHSTHVEYQSLIKDLVLESEYLGG